MFGVNSLGIRVQMRGKWVPWVYLALGNSIATADTILYIEKFGYWCGGQYLELPLLTPPYLVYNIHSSKLPSLGLLLI